MSMENFDKCLEMLMKSRMRVVALLGGEPTLHPYIIDFLEKCRKNDYFKIIKLFTNGLVPNDVIEYLEDFPGDKIQIALNIHPKQDYSPKQWRRVKRVLAGLGDKIGLGYNIYKTDNQFSYLLQLYLEYNLRPHVRLGLTQPIFAMDNAYLREKEFPAIGEEIVSAAREFTAKGLYFSFDCGFPFCMFSSEQHKEFIDCAINFRSVCKPIIDIGTELTVWRCFPLSRCNNISLEDFETRMDMVDYYTQKFKPYRQFGLYDRCNNCRYLIQELCCGGCLGRVMRSFNMGHPDPYQHVLRHTGD